MFKKKQRQNKRLKKLEKVRKSKEIGRAHV